MPLGPVLEALAVVGFLEFLSKVLKHTRKFSSELLQIRPK
jgi:hypothetical protein